MLIVATAGTLLAAEGVATVLGGLFALTAAAKVEQNTGLFSSMANNAVENTKAIGEIAVNGVKKIRNLTHIGEKSLRRVPAKKELEGESWEDMREKFVAQNKALLDKRNLEAQKHLQVQKQKQVQIQTQAQAIGGGNPSLPWWRILLNFIFRLMQSLKLLTFGLITFAALRWLSKLKKVVEIITTTLPWIGDIAYSIIYNLGNIAWQILTFIYNNIYLIPSILAIWGAFYAIKYLIGWDNILHLLKKTVSVFKTKKVAKKTTKKYKQIKKGKRKAFG